MTVRQLIGDTSDRRGLTLIWRHRGQYGFEFVLWNHAWFIGLDRNR